MKDYERAAELLISKVKEGVMNEMCGNCKTAYERGLSDGFNRGTLSAERDSGSIIKANINLRECVKENERDIARMFNELNVVFKEHKIGVGLTLTSIESTLVHCKHYIEVINQLYVQAEKLSSIADSKSMEELISTFSSLELEVAQLKATINTLSARGYVVEVKKSAKKGKASDKK